MGNQASHDKVPLPLALALKTVQGAVEALAIHRCPVGKTPFFANALFPWASELAAAAPDMIREYEAFERRVQDMPGLEELSPEQRFLSNDKCWKSFVLKTYAGEASPLARECCPKTFSALEKIPGCRMAFFSILEPGKALPPHRGPYAGILRCHVGIKIPKDKERCRLRVAETWRHWEKGQVLIFDDSYDHEAVNDTSERRVILFVDFVRPLGAPFDRINRTILDTLFDKAEFAKTFSERQKAWEASVRAAWAEAAAAERPAAE